MQHKYPKKTGKKSGVNVKRALGLRVVKSPVMRIIIEFAESDLRK